MVAFKVLVLAAAMCVIFQAAIASQLSIYTGSNCFESTLKETVGCTDGRGVGADSACINFADNDVSYTFSYQGTPLRVYYSAGCVGEPLISSHDVGCTQVANAESYKVLCRSRGN